MNAKQQNIRERNSTNLKEEEARIAAQMEEEEQKSLIMKEKIEGLG